MTSQARTRRVIVLGSTGSIGTNTLDVIRHLQRIGWTLEIVGLAAGQRGDVLIEQAKAFDVSHVGIVDAAQAHTIESHGMTAHVGEDCALHLVNAVAQSGDVVIGAMVGAAGIPAIMRAIDLGCTVALANKETLVAAGGLVVPHARANGVPLLPIDSEHSAIFQCLQAGREPSEVERVILTASGGPFRTWTADAIASATVEQALNHPTWSMGQKNTIDSASLMNKALEVIEAHWLFDLPSSRIDVLVHPASLVHGVVEFVDGSVVAQMSPPDMRMPIQYAMTWPERVDGRADRMDWSTFRELVFEPVDHERFGAIRLASQVIDAGGTAGAIFNAANEVAVNEFLAGRISFGDITRIVAAVLADVSVTPVTSLDDVLAADAESRARATSTISASSQSSSSMKSKSSISGASRGTGITSS
ncbi:MAG: 1-deoxy-D-xylulose-5-phosphate reductoisomerase [Planctomycetota bacterium]